MKRIKIMLLLLAGLLCAACTATEPPAQASLSYGDVSVASREGAGSVLDASDPSASLAQESSLPPLSSSSDTLPEVSSAPEPLSSSEPSAASSENRGDESASSSSQPLETSGAAEPPKSQEYNEGKAGDVQKYTTGRNFLGEVERGIIDEINAERESLGLSRLQYNNDLATAARYRSRELQENGVWAHTRPNGDSWATILKEEVPVDFIGAGENLAYIKYNDPSQNFHTDPAWWFNEWKESPPHYETICRPELTDIGVGVYYTKREDGMILANATTLFTQME